MAERLTSLRATQVARAQGPARPTISADKLAFFCNPASGGMLQALQFHCIVGYKNYDSQGLWRLQGRLDCRCRPLPGSGSDSEVKTEESKGVPASCCLGPRRTWNTAWESLRKFVRPELFQRINAIKKLRLDKTDQEPLDRLSAKRQ
jgi:hypothetical protein